MGLFTGKKKITFGPSFPKTNDVTFGRIIEHWGTVGTF